MEVRSHEKHADKNDNNERDIDADCRQGCLLPNALYRTLVEALDVNLDRNVFRYDHRDNLRTGAIPLRYGSTIAVRRLGLFGARIFVIAAAGFAHQVAIASNYFDCLTPPCFVKAFNESVLACTYCGR
jgi:hypothetical protein